MHKDLSDKYRISIEAAAGVWAQFLHNRGQSIGIAREAMINAFDRAAEELDELKSRAQSDRDYYDKHAPDLHPIKE